MMNLRNFRLTTIFIQCLPLLLYSDFQEEEETFSSCCFYQETSAGHCFNPPARKDVQGNIIGHIDFLLLMAQEEGLAYAIKDPVPVNFSVGAPVPLPQNGRVKHVQIGFHPGLRATLIGNLPHDGWDMALSWTHFSYDQRKNTVSDVSNNSLFPIRGVSTLIGNLVHKAGAKWDLRFDTLDLGLGRAYWIGDFLSVHPILGVRSAWIKQDFNITYTFVTTGSNGNSALRASSFRSKDRNHFWGIGPLAELDLNFAFNSTWSLYGHGGVALLWGFFDVSDNQTLTHDVSVTGLTFLGVPTLFDVTDRIDTLKVDAELNLGIQWDTYFCNNFYHLGFHLGWEYHIWFEQNQFIILLSSDQIIKPLGDLSLSGLVFGADFNF